MGSRERGMAGGLRFTWRISFSFACWLGAGFLMVSFFV